MSYILDALKKSEKERQKKNLPDILTVQEPVLNDKKRRSLWPYALIAVLIVNMGTFGYFLVQRKAEMTKGIDPAGQQQNESKPSEPQKHEMTQTGIHPAAPDIKEIIRNRSVAKGKEPEVAAHEIQENKIVQEKAVQKNRIIAKAPMQPVSPGMKEPRQEVQSDQKQTTSVKTGNSGKAANIPAAPEQKSVRPDISPAQDKIYSTGELPESIRQSLPSVNVSIFMYSDDPATRMVRINGQTYREGQKISEDLKLERITPSGIILNYRNYRFQAGQQQSSLTPLHQ